MLVGYWFVIAGAVLFLSTLKRPTWLGGNERRYTADDTTYAATARAQKRTKSQKWSIVSRDSHEPRSAIHSGLVKWCSVTTGSMIRIGQPPSQLQSAAVIGLNDEFGLWRSVLTAYRAVNRWEAPRHRFAKGKMAAADMNAFVDSFTIHRRHDLHRQRGFRGQPLQRFVQLV